MSKQSLREEIITELGTFEIPMADSFFIAEKAAEICKQYFDGDTYEFINQLLAFRINCKIADKEPLTEEFLGNFERSKTEDDPETSGRKSQYNNVTPSSSKKSINGSYSSANISHMNGLSRDVTSLLFEYGVDDIDNGTTEGLVEDNHENGQSREDEYSDMEVEDYVVSSTPALAVITKQFSPVGTPPSQNCIDRSNAYQVISDFGDTSSSNWSTERNRPISFGELVRHCESVPCLDKSYYFMNQTLRIIETEINARVECLKEKMLAAYPEVGQEGTTHVCGIVHNGGDAKTSKLKEDKIYLHDPNLPEAIILDVSSLPEYSLFSGQVACFGGTLIKNEKLIAKSIYPGCRPPSSVFDNGDHIGALDCLSIVVASGPFTLANNFDYEPLTALLDYVKQHRPHVLILTGPIVPVGRDDHLTLSISCQELYDNVLLKMTEACSGAGTKLVLVASADDAAALPCYPTPPASTQAVIDGNNQPFLCSDPCLLRIGGLVFGITSTDVLCHLSSLEFFKTTAFDENNDRMTRLVQHLLSQQTFYPVLPPALSMIVDVEHLIMFAKLPLSPHVLVLPSILKPFIKDVGDVMAINPGHLVKAGVGGTFCRFEFDRRKLAQENGNVMRCIRSQVLRL